MKNLNLLSLIFILISVISACHKENKKINNIQNNSIGGVYNPNVIIKTSKNRYKIGDTISGFISIADSSAFDSAVIFFNSKKILTTTERNTNLTLFSATLNVGEKSIEVIAYSSKKSKSFKKYVKLLSDITPEIKTYKVIKEYPHDRNAYTQGLVFWNDTMYESTGLRTKSTLRKTDFKTGEVLYSITLGNNLFGEGITILNNKIIQVTWQNHEGIVYNLDNFQKITTFSYPTEGWGLATDGKVIYLSDGTNIIQILEPNSYSKIGEIEVYDNNGPVKLLNELEYINGLIYANVYTMDYIVVIDPKTGKVLENINMSGLLPNSLRDQTTDVLNGIAYDSKRNKIYVTGKNWPRLYEIKIIDKK